MPSVQLSAACRFMFLATLLLRPDATAGAQRLKQERIVVRGSATGLATVIADWSPAEPAFRAPFPAPEERFFSSGDWYLSTRLWIAGVDAGATAYGVSLEKAVNDPQGDDEGIWAIGVSFDRYHYSYFGIVDVSVVPVGAILNYHFVLNNPRVDPYVGAGLGYYIVSVSGGGFVDRASSTFVQTQLGVRYALSDAFAIGAHVGSGFGNMAISGTLKLGR